MRQTLTAGHATKVADRLSFFILSAVCRVGHAFSDIFAESSAAAVLASVKEFPLLLHILVVGELGVALGPSVAVFDVDGKQVGKQ